MMEQHEAELIAARREAWAQGYMAGRADILKALMAEPKDFVFHGSPEAKALITRNPYLESDDD